MPSRAALSVLILLCVASCSPALPASPSVLGKIAPSTQPPAAQPTAALIPTAAPAFTLTPSPTETPTPPEAAIPPFLTSTSGIAATLTAVYSTPGALETLAAQQTMLAATEAVKMPMLSTGLLSQCPNPSDPPMQTWGIS